MKKLLSIMLIFILSGFVLAACSSNSSSSAPPAIPPTATPPAQSNAPEPNGEDDVTFHDAQWIIEARIEDKVDVGALYSFAGMYQTYVYVIYLSHQGPDPAGEYYLTMDYSVTLNSDEAADSLLSAELGTEISGMELGVNGVANGRVELENDPLTVSKIAPQHMIKDKNGNQVSMGDSNYFLEEKLTIPYESSGGTAIYGYNFGGPSEDVIRMFIAFEWDYNPEIDDPITAYYLPVDVYITYPEFAAKEGHEIWHHAEGTITRKAIEW